MIKLDRQSPLAAHWSRQQYETLFAQPKFATSNSGLQHSLVWVADDADEAGTQQEVSRGPNRPLALLVARAVDPEWELENIVVEKESRRRGVATRLLGEFLNHARTSNASAVFLEVRQSNQSARSLYCKFGFVETGSRKSYYATPREDAILYRLGFY
jgi:ribosomal-protein-alanine acetyltransferase